MCQQIAFAPARIEKHQHAGKRHLYLWGLAKAPREAVQAALARFAGHRGFEVADVADRPLDPALQVLRQAPVRQAQPGAGAVEPAVEPQRALVGPVAHVGQPLGALDHAVKIVAMRNP